MIKLEHANFSFHFPKPDRVFGTIKYYSSKDEFKRYGFWADIKWKKKQIPTPRRIKHIRLFHPITMTVFTIEPNPDVINQPIETYIIQKMNELSKLEE